MCWRRTGRGAPAGTADRGHPGAGPARCGICRGTPAGRADRDVAYRDIFASVAGRRKTPRPAGPVPVPQGPPAGHPVHRQRPVQGAGQREAAPAQDRGRASAPVTPAAASALTGHGHQGTRPGRRAGGDGPRSAGTTGSSPGAAQHSSKPTPAAPGRGTGGNLRPARRTGRHRGPVIPCQPCAPSCTGRTRKAPDAPDSRATIRISSRHHSHHRK
jgi:hypothetical protein